MAKFKAKQLTYWQIKTWKKNKLKVETEGIKEPIEVGRIIVGRWSISNGSGKIKVEPGYIMSCETKEIDGLTILECETIKEE